MDKLFIDNNPINTITTDITIAKTGRFINLLNIIKVLKGYYYSAYNFKLEIAFSADNKS